MLSVTRLSFDVRFIGDFLANLESYLFELQGMRAAQPCLPDER
jgi:hypothetical protein